MSKKEKLIQRFKATPTNFQWNELKKLLSIFGFEQINAGKTGGSRVKFVHVNHPVIFLHKPHPQQILKQYQVEYIFEFLVNEGLL